MKAIIVGPDRGIEAALREAGAETARLEFGTGAALGEAGVAEADLLVITDVGEATAVPVARDLHPGIAVVVYSPDTMPEFVRGQVDLAVDPALLSPEAVAEELVAEV